MNRVWDRIQDWVLLFLMLGVSAGVMLMKNEPLLRGMRGASLEGTAWVESRFAWIGGYFRALQENAILREENIQLSSEVARSREAVIENDRLRRLMGFRDTTAYPLQAARIVSKDITQQQNYFTIDAGSADSVEVGMAVIDERGVLGRVVLVSERYARVMSYLNTRFRIPAKIQPLQAAGIIRWEGNRPDRLLLEHIVKTEQVEPGQLVVTSGFSSIFPPGYPIGVVDSVSTHSGRNALDVYVRPTSPVSSAEHAFVVLTRPEPERIALENQPTQ